MDCKLFSQSHCTLPLTFWCNTRCTRNVVIHQIAFCFVNYFHNIFGTITHFFHSVKLLFFQVNADRSGIVLLSEHVDTFNTWWSKSKFNVTACEVALVLLRRLMCERSLFYSRVEIASLFTSGGNTLDLCD